MAKAVERMTGETKTETNFETPPLFNRKRNEQRGEIKQDDHTGLTKARGIRTVPFKAFLLW